MALGSKRSFRVVWRLLYGFFTHPARQVGSLPHVLLSTHAQNFPSSCPVISCHFIQNEKFSRDLHTFRASEMSAEGFRPSSYSDFEPSAFLKRYFTKTSSISYAVYRPHATHTPLLPRRYREASEHWRKLGSLIFLWTSSFLMTQTESFHL